MKGIYLTPKAKQELEDTILQLEKEQKTEGEVLYIIGKTLINTYKEILKSAIVIPVEEDWDVVHENCYANFLNHKEDKAEDYFASEEKYFKAAYPLGVIIQPQN